MRSETQTQSAFQRISITNGTPPPGSSPSQIHIPPISRQTWRPINGQCSRLTERPANPIIIELIYTIIHLNLSFALDVTGGGL